ncbi:Rft-1-domain-containing protein [Atractiella rhizophila]|nr:Rft-1-domain-containing protein [Atractiella rhizophila]
MSSAVPLILLSATSRVLTFALNQSLLRVVSPAVLGTASIQFETLLNTILFLSREGVRGALIRRPFSSPSLSPPLAVSETRIRNTATLPLLLGTPVTLLLASLYLYTLPLSTISQPYFHPALALYLLSTLIELVTEPYYILAQRSGDVSLRVRIEGRAVVLKSVATLGAIWYGGEDRALLGFGIGQVVWSLALLGGYGWRYFSLSGGESVPLVPQRVIEENPIEGRFDPSSLDLAKSLTRQSLVKQFLSEGDKMIVSYISPPSQQGGYALALNYGSLIARVLFQPIEESSRLHYSSSSPSTTTSGANSSLRLLTSLLTFQTHLSLLLLLLAPPYISPLLTLVLGRRWSSPSSSSSSSSAADILKAYVYHLPFLGINGITEAFVQSVAEGEEITNMSKAMVLFSAIYLAAVAFFVKVLGWEERGMIAANAVNMGCRILYAVYFIQSWIGRRRLTPKVEMATKQEVMVESTEKVERVEGNKRDGLALPVTIRWGTTLPSRSTLFAFLIAGAAVRWSEASFASDPNGVKGMGVKGLAIHLGTGAVCGIGCLVVL